MFNPSGIYQMRARNSKWFNLSAKKDNNKNVGVLEIYDAIDPIWGISDKDLIASLRAMDADEIRVYINSPGGSVFSGMNIYNALKSSTATIKTYVSGLAASIASVIALAGDEVNIYENSYLMIHQAWGISLGNAQDMLKIADNLEKFDNTIVDIYNKKTNKDKADILAKMQEETWFNALEAKEYGLVNTVITEDAAKGAMAFDLSIYKNTPNILSEITNKELMNKAKEDLELKQYETKKNLLKKRLSLSEID